MWQLAIWKSRHHQFTNHQIDRLLAIAVSWKPTPVRSAMVSCCAVDASRFHAGDDLAELRVDAVGVEQPGVERVAQLAERGALRQAIDHQQVRPREAGGVELLLAGRVGSERRDVLPGTQPVGPHQRRARRRRA